MELIDYLRLARELTGSSDLKELMVSARYLQAEMNPKETSEANYDATSISWLTVRTVSDFISSLKIQHPVKGTISFNPYAFQKDMTRSIEDSDKKVILVNSSRQMGNSISLNALALYRAVTRPGHILMIAANKFHTALENLSRIRTMIETCELPLPSIEVSNKQAIHFNNGSKIIACSVRKEAVYDAPVDTVIIHDAAYIPWGIEKVWWDELQAALSDGGQIILSSSPYKKKGLFYSLWLQDADLLGSLKLKYIWSDHPDRDEAWANYMRGQLGLEKFSSEHEGVFLDHDDEV